MTAVRHYTYQIAWSEEDGEHVALRLEFPSLSFLANTLAEALEGLIATIGEVVEDMNRVRRGRSRATVQADL